MAQIVTQANDAGPDSSAEAHFRPEPSSSMDSLARELNEFCVFVEQQQRKVAVVNLSAFAENSRTWPGRVSIQDVNRWERALRRFELLKAATIVVNEGPVEGPALDLFLVGDYRIAAAGIRLRPTKNSGSVWPSMSLYRLVQQIGQARARQVIYADDGIDAQQALSFGLIDETSEDVDASLAIATARLSLSAKADASIVRQLLIDSSTTSFEDARGTFLAACDRELRKANEDK